MRARSSTRSRRTRWCEHAPHACMHMCILMCMACVWHVYGMYAQVWLGSVCTDGRRLVSDGRDNCILVHDFEEQDEAEAES